MSPKLVHGWTPHKVPEDEEEAQTPLLSDMVDTSDPNWREIVDKLFELHALGVEITKELIGNVSDRVREHSARTGVLDMRIRAPRQLSDNSIDGAEDSLVYYMRIGNRVKIGYSAKIAERLKAINPEELMAIEPGGYEIEQARHRQFAHLRSHGEWFRLEGLLASHVEQLQSIGATT